MKSLTPEETEESTMASMYHEIQLTGEIEVENVMQTV